MSAPTILGAAQLIPVSDIARSEAFYVDGLGFEAVVRNDDYKFVTVRRGVMMIGLQGNMDASAVKVTSEMMATQVWVAGLTPLENT